MQTPCDRVPAPEQMWLVQHVSYVCNNRCKFCIVQDKLGRQAPLEILLKDHKTITAPAERIYLTGGEPTLNPHLPQIIASASGIADEVWLQSNARLFSRMPFAERIASTIDGAMISFHTHIPQDAGNLLGNAKALEEIMAGIDNLRQLGMPLVISAVMTKYNYHSINATLKFIRQNLKGIKTRLIYSFFNANSPSEHYFPLKDLQNGVLDGILRENPSTEVENVPLCIADLRKYSANFEDGWKLVLLKDRQLFFPRQTRTYLPICEKCTASRDCNGLYKHYSSKFDPSKELKPI